MLKMDFLGLKTLTVIEDTVKLIHEHTPAFSLNEIPLDDPATFALFNRGETIGLFQMESGGMTGTAKQFDVQKLDDIIALIALYRPGPMDLIPDYIKRKKGLTKVRYAHPLLEEVCADTYGIMIYQEQVMAAANVLAGYSLGQADLLRRAMGKKDKEKMAKERANFIDGCARTNNIPEKKANAIFDLLEKFAGYGFNKSHSAAYGVISYQTAYLKANYPVEFMAGLLSNEINNTDKISIFVGECKRMGIPILPPDVNRSGLKFTPEPNEKQPGIRYGLAAIKNVGEGAMDSAIAGARTGRRLHFAGGFLRATRFAHREPQDSGKPDQCGAFDFLGRERAELFACIDESLAAAASSHRDRATGQVSLFGEMPAAPIARRSHELSPGREHEKLSYEKELLGFYVTGHPLDAYAPLFASGKYQTISSLGELEDRARFTIAGAIAQVDKKFTKKEGKPFAVVWLEDLTGMLEVVLWNESYTPVAADLELGKVIAVRGKLDRRDDAVRATAEKVRLLTLEVVARMKEREEEAHAASPPPIQSPRVREEISPLTLRFNAGIAAEELHTVRQILASSPGAQPVTLMLTSQDGQQVFIDAGDRCRVELTPAIEEQLAPWL